MKTEQQLREQFEKLKNVLGERARRVWAASEATALGHGGGVLVAKATGIVRATIWQGKQDILAAATETSEMLPAERSRKAGGGRPRAVVKDPDILVKLKSLVEPDARGDPVSSLQWTTKSTRNLADEISKAGTPVSHKLVGRCLKELGFSLQANAKVLEGSSHEDRDAQFRHIYQTIHEQREAGDPTISVDTKKKELVGNYKNAGTDLRPKGNPTLVKSHDFIGDLGRANPYGVLDIFACSGWVSVGMTADTAEFAVETIRRWWHGVGRVRYPDAKTILITADCGGSNGYRVRLWKVALQKLADELGIGIRVCHFPPGTSKWNQIEHQLFSFITQNWRGRPLVDFATIVSLIGATKTKKGLTVECHLDDGQYEKGKKISDSELNSVNIVRDTFHGEWNYTIWPRSQRNEDST